MRLANLRLDGGAVAVRIAGDQVFATRGSLSLSRLLAQPDWTDAAAEGHLLGAVSDVVPSQWGPVIGPDARIVCVGLNYRDHIQEMKRPEPAHPTLFGRVPECAIGPFDRLELRAAEIASADWEAELAVIVGAVIPRGTRARPEHIAGYTVVNDVTIRDYQYRTTQWYAGKTVEGTLPNGPVLVTPDEYEPGTEIRAEIDGEVVQRGRTDDVVFAPLDVLTAAAEIFSLRPGDALLLGTPAGVGHAREPRRYLEAGSVLTTSIAGIGTLENRIHLLPDIEGGPA